MSTDSTLATAPAPPIPESPQAQIFAVVFLALAAFCLALIMLVTVFYKPLAEAMSRSVPLLGVFVLSMAGAGRVSMDTALKFLTDVILKRMAP